jgi:hypothetical protein
MKSIKTATSALKTYITDLAIMINPKMKTPMEIPNFCNFFIYSNESDTLYLREDSRRYYIVDIPHQQKLIIEKLETNNFKDRLLASLEPTGPGPSNFLCHFQNNVKIPNTKIFHTSATLTTALETLMDR